AQPGWGLALGAAALPDAHGVEPQARGAIVTLSYSFKLEPGASRSWLFLLTVGQKGGASEAEALWHALIDRAAAHFNDDPAVLREGLPALSSAEPDLGRDFALAQANLNLLEADYQDTGPYFLAGLPERPQLFGCDTAYSVSGAAAAGFTKTCRSALTTLARYAERACGRVPHEITTNGRVFHPGNIQETPQLALAVWDYVRWAGDLAFAERLFPVCREGLLAYLPAIGGPDPRYPFGDGMAERPGIGVRQLDSVCYTIAGMRALARLAQALGEPEAAAIAARADAHNQAFEADWWLEGEGLYADTMHPDGRLQLDGHWSTLLPVQLGLAAPERVSRVMAHVEAELVSQWGFAYTRAHEEAVWALPTGLLALISFRCGRPERGLDLARAIALSARHGTLGTFKELLPTGRCFVQLSSAALYLQSILEGLLGLSPDAPAGRLQIAPALPEGLGPVTVRGLMVGPHRLSLTLAPRSLRLEHLEGPRPLIVTYAGTEAAVEPTAVLEKNA
ncbi:MAG: amylo-alpha-1,6-glucosidase, partial [Chloroflexales bacterium]|nr:amylo-alpha-1,6-glucosidase [Chloroflexales bacterium]